MDMFKNDFFVLKQVHQFIQVQVHRKGFPLHKLENILSRFPTIKITNQKALYGALLLAKNVPIVIGERIPEISLSISQDKMMATLMLACTEDDLRERKEYFVAEILKVLHENQVSDGLLLDVLQGNLIPQTEIIIAKGTESINGEDAVVTYYTLSDRKPTIRQDGKADYYDMNFIDEVKKGAWLGEKTPPTNGTPGKTVTGEMVVPRKGRDFRLMFDRKTVEEVEEENKVVLRARIDGVVAFKDGKIAVGDHLMINDDVGVSTGNIIFDGSVTIKGIVHPGFSVKATKDISILGEMGLSGIKLISSQGGDIFIKGGLFGQGESTVKAGKNIFIKHANDCTLIAKEDIHIGYYSIGSNLKARHILADEQKGKIIGGKIEAMGKISSAVIGNRMERKTWIYIEGFNRRMLEDELLEQLTEYKKELAAYETLKSRVEAFENSPLKKDEIVHLRNLERELENKFSYISKVDERCKYVANLLEVKGEGELDIKRTAYPETYIEIKRVKKKITSKVSGKLFIDGYYLQTEN